MAEYQINKGIGRSVEFKGLKSQYLFIFAGGLLADFFLFIILYMAGVSQWICFAVAIIIASVLIGLTFYLNNRFGEYGIMKLFALRTHPKWIRNNKSIYKILKK